MRLAEWKDSRLTRWVTNSTVLLSAFALITLAGPRGEDIPRRQEKKTPGRQVESERWNLFWQATSIGQYHGVFRSPYKGPFSLENYPERDVSLTTTLFFGFRFDQNTQLYFDPEIAGGRGFSGVNGLANSSNGELPRVSSPVSAFRQAGMERR